MVRSRSRSSPNPVQQNASKTLPTAPRKPLRRCAAAAGHGREVHWGTRKNSKAPVGGRTGIDGRLFQGQRNCNRRKLVPPSVVGCALRVRSIAEAPGLGSHDTAGGCVHYTQSSATALATQVSVLLSDWVSSPCCSVADISRRPAFGAVGEHRVDRPAFCGKCARVNHRSSTPCSQKNPAPFFYREKSGKRRKTVGIGRNGRK